MSLDHARRLVLTGSSGFIGSNLIVHLSERSDLDIVPIDRHNAETELDAALDNADIVFHLAGVNRPQDPAEFERGNHGLTARIVSRLREREKPPIVAATSSIQALKDNPYGLSKRAAEEELFRLANDTDARSYVYRLPNVFGKWCRPNYNSVVATFCHQVANGETPSVNDAATPVTLVYIDDVVSSLIAILDGQEPVRNGEFYTVTPTFDTTVGEIAEILQSFPLIRTGGALPDFAQPLQKNLYSTYLSHLSEDVIMYNADKKSDDRGYLYELVKSKSAGQVFVSRTKPGITRGNHYHHTKVEKFCVIDGTAAIRLRHLVSGDTIQIDVEGTQCRVVDIPPGYTHSITNTGDGDLLTLFWANEIFDPDRPDTYFQPV